MHYPVIYQTCPRCSRERRVGAKCVCGFKPIEPQVGPQQAFAACGADIAVFGGQAGGGKSASLILEACKWAHLPYYGAILFRRTFDDLKGSGSLWELVLKWYPHMGARLVEGNALEAKWDNGALVKLQHLHPVDREVLTHDGKQYAFIGVDEAQYVTSFELWYLWSRCRDPNNRVKPCMRLTCNPEPDCYLRELLDWWIGEDGYPIPERDGVLRYCIRPDEELIWFDTEAECRAFIIENAVPGARPISVTFIRSTLDDNKIQGQEWIDTYKGNLAIQGKDVRAKKLGGNWNTSLQSGEMFDRRWFDILDKMPDPSQVEFECRGWDKAASKVVKGRKVPDWTRGVKLTKLKNGDVIVSDVVGCQDTPGEVDSLIYHTAQMDGPHCEQAFWIDPGQAGLVDEAHTRSLFQGLLTVGKGRGALPCLVSFQGIQGKDKVFYAKPWSSYADPAVPLGRFFLLRGAWNGAYLSELEKFPVPTGKDFSHLKDDQVDATSRAWIEVAKRKTGTLGAFFRAMEKVRI